jgi:hypothetical protein
MLADQLRSRKPGVWRIGVYISTPPHRVKILAARKEEARVYGSIIQYSFKLRVV